MNIGVIDPVEFPGLRFTGMVFGIVVSLLALEGVPIGVIISHLCKLLRYNSGLTMWVFGVDYLDRVYQSAFFSGKRMKLPSYQISRTQSGALQAHPLML